MEGESKEKAKRNKEEGAGWMDGLNKEKAKGNKKEVGGWMEKV